MKRREWNFPFLLRRRSKCLELYRRRFDAPRSSFLVLYAITLLGQRHRRCLRPHVLCGRNSRDRHFGGRELSAIWRREFLGWNKRIARTLRYVRARTLKFSYSGFHPAVRSLSLCLAVSLQPCVIYLPRMSFASHVWQIWFDFKLYYMYKESYFLSRNFFIYIYNRYCVIWNFLFMNQIIYLLLS